MEKVPADIAQCIVVALWLLRQAEASIAHGAAMEKRRADQGRYQADAIIKSQSDIQWAWRILSNFRQSRVPDGIEVEAFIRGLGGEADLTPTAEAASLLPPEILWLMRSKVAR